MIPNMIRLTFTLLLLAAVAGCGETKPLGGKVTFSDDGSPLTTGTVCFTDGTNFSRAELKPDGTFSVRTLGKNDGIKPGNYRVFVSGAESITSDAEGNDVVTPLIAEKFTSGDTSGLTFNVDGSTRKFDFTVDRPGKKE